VAVAELAVERGDGGRGEEIGGHHPGHVLDIAKLAADRRQGGRDDGLVEGREQHRDDDAADDGADLAVAERPRRRPQSFAGGTVHPACHGA
jgi:hypothetical protein